MRKIFYFLACLLGFQLAPAQVPGGGNTQPSAASIPGTTAPKGKGKITGTVIDSTNNQPVPFVTVALTNPVTQKPIDGAMSDDKGRFSLEKVAEGDYQVVLSFIGYQPRTINNVRVSDRKDEVNLGNILVRPSVTVLQEVTIQGQRSLIEEKVDRTVYNAEADATNQGGDATDVLRKVPMLSVDMDGNVTMRGSQNIRVLINNKPSTIMAGSIADALKQIPSDMIKSVEVITSPSAKYDAEGSGGIINIVTKKNNLQGFSLNLDASAGLRGSNLGLNGSYRKGKMGFTLGGHGRAGYNIRGSFDNTQVTSRIDENGESQLVTNQQTAHTLNQMLFGRYQFGWDYDINKNNYLNASVQYGMRNRNTDQNNLLTQTFIGDELQRQSLRAIDVTDLSGTLDVDLNYTHTFAKPQREFSILTQYSRNNRTNNFFTDSLNLESGEVNSRLKNINDSYNQEITLQADYQTPISRNQMLEIGGKDIMRKVTSDYQYFTALGSDGPFEPLTTNGEIDQRFTNIFNYDQNIMAGYLSYTVNFGKVYSLKAGSRYEYTTINAHYQNEQDKLEIPSYGVFVPSVNLSKKLKKGNTVKLAYNRRIQRPSLQFLNPNIQATNNLNVTIGNPDLRPEFTNNFEVSYNTNIKNSSLNFSAFVRNTNNAIQSVRDVIPGTDTIRTTYQNIGREDGYGFSIFANINLSNKFSINGGTDVYYAYLRNNVPDPTYNAGNTGWVASGRVFGNYTIAKGWGLQAFAFYRGRQVQLQGTQGGFGVYSLSLKKDINKQGSIGFGAENFFNVNGFRMRSELNTPVISQTSTNVMRNLNFKVNFNYRIGKMKMDETQSRRRRKSVSNDDLKEGGDNNQGGGEAQPQGGQRQGTSGSQTGGQRPAQGQPQGDSRKSHNQLPGKDNLLRPALVPVRSSKSH